MTLCLPFNAFSETLQVPRPRRFRRASGVSARQPLVRSWSGCGWSRSTWVCGTSPLVMYSSDLATWRSATSSRWAIPSTAPLEVTTNDVIFAHAIAGNHRRRLAAQIVPTPPAKKEKS